MEQVLSSLAIIENDEPNNDTGIGDKSGELVEGATRLGPTVFPIVFAALVGRALKAIGRFKSEKGIKFSTLWAFLPTKTVFDAVLLQWSAGALSLPTILVGLLWAMSPAGGQASLRMLYRTNQTSVSSTSIHYMDTGPLGILYTYATLFEGYDMGPYRTEFPFPITASFAAALMQDFETKSGPRDSWGNPKVPRLDMLNQFNGQSVWSPTVLELFMNKTSTIPVYRANAYTLGGGNDWFYTDLAHREPETLSGRATLLLNTAMHLLYSYYGFAGDLPSVEAADWGPPHSPADGFAYVSSIINDAAAFVAASTEASVTRDNNVYKVNYAWWTVLVISATALAIIGSIGMITGLRTRGPDVFDPLMGLTYNNGSLGLPTPGSSLDTDRRAELLRDMRVRLGDVAGGKSVGMVGVGRARSSS
ncbi:hypothetical protein INS49_012769 [Diaporthe citri]|uniref:uncharacterized protein n=1 Tax=Diaporthe citri TaxID=83186 RepID=UPI001C81852F|nr:uncharacterized protein INS49_012769 [Diaporthe citri]KAG6359248.1 hypothetical protein INS49_012769 [Diaporthe citri]